MGRNTFHLSTIEPGLEIFQEWGSTTLSNPFQCLTTLTKNFFEISDRITRLWATRIERHGLCYASKAKPVYYTSSPVFIGL